MGSCSNRSDPSLSPPTTFTKTRRPEPPITRASEERGMGIEIGGQIEKLNGKELGYNEFAERYLAKNKPVVLTGLVVGWRARKDWVMDEERPNLRFFDSHFGESKVQVADCSIKEFTDQKRTETSVSEFINHWLESSGKVHGKETTYCGNGKSILYLKDWHFVKEYPEYVAYQTPLPFCDDWLNVYLDNYRMHQDPETCQENDEISCSDYRFVYMGAKGSWTPLHADVFRSYSWSANVCGRKRWLFLPPSQSHLVFDRHMRNCVYDIFEDINETKFPGFKKTIWLECIQEHDEVIFVPSGWYHQVHNLEDTISINHNWFNAYNLPWVWDLLSRDYKDTKESIEDIRDICDDFEAICQRNLAANTGMNFYDFFLFMSRFSLANVVQHHNLLNGCRNGVSSLSSVARNLAMNLSVIRKIMLKMKSIYGLAANKTYLDLRETLEDPLFHKLCRDLGRTYGMVHKQQLSWNFHPSELSVFSLEDHKTLICTPEDLIEFIDHAFGDLGIAEVENNISLSQPDDTA